MEIEMGNDDRVFYPAVFCLYMIYLPLIGNVGIPLGDKTEPLLKAAIEYITGTQVLASKSAVIKPQFKIFDRGFSRFDRYKRELLYNQLDKKLLLK